MGKEYKKLELKQTKNKWIFSRFQGLHPERGRSKLLVGFQE